MNASRLAPIRADELIPLPILKARLGWEKTTLRQAKLRGLPIRKFGRQKFVLGSDVIEFFRQIEPGDGVHEP